MLGAEDELLEDVLEELEEELEEELDEEPEGSPDDALEELPPPPHAASSERIPRHAPPIISSTAPLDLSCRDTRDSPALRANVPSIGLSFWSLTADSASKTGA